jgi:hypothetical protein
MPGSNPYLPHSLRDGEKQPQRKPPVRKADTSLPLKYTGGAPIGTAAQILRWVGDDPERAALALEREREEPKPRVSLVAGLGAVLKRGARSQEPAAAAPGKPKAADPLDDVRAMMAARR